MKLLAVVLVLCSLVVFCASAEKTVRYEKYSVHKVFIENKIQLTIAKVLSETIDGYSIWRPFVGVGSDFDIMVSPTVLESFNRTLKVYKFRTELLIPNVQKLIDEQIPKASALKLSDAPSNRTTQRYNTLTWDRYHTLEEIYEWLDYICKEYSQVAFPLTIGKSYEGREIRGIRIKFPYSDSGVFIEANSVAKEWLTGATATFLIREILEKKDIGWRWLCERVEWYIVPVLNVDGYVYSHKYNRLWRKTRQPHIATNCVGADLSRNFNYKWMNQGTAGIPCSDIYAGAMAFSEPESKALTVFIRSLRGAVGLFISLRAYGQHILTPYAYTDDDRPDDYGQLLDIAKSSADNIKSKHGTIYTTGAASTIVGIASGNSADWGTSSIPGFAASLTWVLRDTGRYGYVVPPSHIEASGNELVTGLIKTLDKCVQYNYLW